MDSTTQLFSILIILLALVVTLIVRPRRTRPVLRPIPAYAAVPTLVGLSIESNQPIHLGFGSAGVGGATTLLTLASAELFYQISQRAAIGDTPPLLTTSSASTLPIAQDTMRRAYQSRGRLDRYRYSSARWYPNGSRSLAYAAALSAAMGDDQISSNVLAGNFGPEIALIMEAGARRNLPSIAASDALQGQAVAFAFSDHLLIGEEIFVARAYLGDNPAQAYFAVRLDFLRWLLILAIIVAFIAQLVTSRGG